MTSSRTPIERIGKERSMKAFRDFLNREYPDAKHRHGKYRQRTRAYGDYLYFQDREKFDVEYQEWLRTGGEKP